MASGVSRAPPHCSLVYGMSNAYTARMQQIYRSRSFAFTSVMLTAIVLSGCAHSPPSVYQGQTRITIDRGPPRLELHSFAGITSWGNRHTPSVAYLGSLGGKGMPCSAEVPSGSEVIVTGGSRLTRPPYLFRVPATPDVHLEVHPGMRPGRGDLVRPTLLVGGLGGVVGGLLLVGSFTDPRASFANPNARYASAERLWEARPWSAGAVSVFLRTDTRRAAPAVERSGRTRKVSARRVGSPSEAPFV